MEKPGHVYGERDQAKRDRVYKCAHLTWASINGDSAFGGVFGVYSGKEGSLCGLESHEG